jgi:phosphoribosylformylglycinamidine cyclo-ligase
MSAEPETALTYKDAGVDLATGDALTQRLRYLCQRTHSPRVLAHANGFAGVFKLDFAEKLFARSYREPVLLASAQGVGSKVQIAAALRSFGTIGLDLVAMCVNNLVVPGGEPLFFQHYLALHTLDPAIAAELVQGMSDGCLQAGCALLGGETAEVPSLHAPDEFDMAGFAVGVVEKHKMLDSADIEAGDSVIGLASSGLHANGYTLARQILDKKGFDLMDFVPELNGTLAEELLRPTRLYARTVQKVLARYKVKKIVKAMAHISRGGLPGNLPRALPEGFAVRLKRDAWPVPPIFTWLQTHGPVDLDEMFHVFNMGIGFVLIVRPTFTRPILSALRALGERPYFLGKIKKSPGPPALEWS